MLTFIVLLFQFSSASFAQTANQARIEPIDPSQPIMLMGKGVRDHESGASLALACSQPCQKIQWLIYFSPSEAYWLGDAMNQLTPENPQYETYMKLYLKALSKEAKNEMKHPTTGFWLLGGGLGAMGLGVLTFGATPLLFTAVGAWQMSVLSGAHQWIGNPGLAMIGSPTETLDRNGFNWSSSPEPVRHRYFMSLLTVLVNRRIQLFTPHLKNLYEIQSIAGEVDFCGIRDSSQFGNGTADMICLLQQKKLLLKYKIKYQKQ